MNTKYCRKVLLVVFFGGIVAVLCASESILARKKGEKNYPLVRKMIPLPGRPAAMALSHDGKRLAVLHAEGLSLVDVGSQSLTKSFSSHPTSTLPDLFFTGDGLILYLSSQQDQVGRLDLAEDSQSPETWISLKEGRAPNGGISGIALSPNQRFLAVGLCQANQVIIYDLAKRLEVAAYSGLKSPYGLVFSRDGRELLVGQQCQRGKTGNRAPSSAENKEEPCAEGTGFVSLIDLEHKSLKAQVEIRSHTGRLCLNKDGSRLYMASTDGSSVTTINVVTGEVAEEISLQLIRKGQTSSAPATLSLDLDGKRLYAAMTDMPWIAVISLGSQSSKSLTVEPSRIEGLIPVPGKPQALGLDLEGRRLLVALSEPVDWSEPQPTAIKSPGAVAIIEMPTAKQWSKWLQSYLESHT